MDFKDLHILVVDDHEDTQKTLGLMLRQLGVEHIITAKDGQQGQEELAKAKEENPVNMILCDWNMPNMSGIDLLKHVRGADQEVPFVMITARGDAPSVEEAKDSGVTGYILKPLTIGELEKKVRLFATRI